MKKCKLETRLKSGDKLGLEDLKTLHLMALLHNTGCVLQSDITPSKLNITFVCRSFSFFLAKKCVGNRAYKGA